MICRDNQLSDTQYLNEIKQKGCKYVFINKHSFHQELFYTKVIENQNFVVYEL
jgi:hypothetical protein